MEEIKREFAAFQQELKEYLKLKLELIQLNAMDSGTEAGARLMAAFVFALASLGILLFLGIGLAFMAGEYLGNLSHGFFAVGGLGLLLAVIGILFNETLIIKPFRFILVKWITRKKKA